VFLELWVFLDPWWTLYKMTFQSFMEGFPKTGVVKQLKGVGSCSIKMLI